MQYVLNDFCFCLLVIDWYKKLLKIRNISQYEMNVKIIIK